MPAPSEEIPARAVQEPRPEEAAHAAHEDDGAERRSPIPDPREADGADSAEDEAAGDSRPRPPSRRPAEGGAARRAAVVRRDEAPVLVVDHTKGSRGPAARAAAERRVRAGRGQRGARRERRLDDRVAREDDLLTDGEEE